MKGYLKQNKQNLVDLNFNFSEIADDNSQLSKSEEYLDKESYIKQATEYLNHGYFDKSIKISINYIEYLKQSNKYKFEIALRNQNLDFLDYQNDSQTFAILRKGKLGKSDYELIIENRKLLSNDSSKYDESSLEQHYTLNSRKELIQFESYLARYLQYKKTDSSYVDYTKSTLVTSYELYEAKGLKSKLEQQAAILLLSMIITEYH